MSARDSLSWLEMEARIKRGEAVVGKPWLNPGL